MIVAAAIAITAAGCGGSQGGGTHGSGGGGGIGIGGAAGDGGAGGAGCSMIDNVGQTVTREQASGDPPMPLGGAIADGTYVLTKDEAYPPISVDMPTHKRETLQISGTQLLAVIESDAMPDPFQGAGTLTTSDALVTINWVCGASGSFDQDYTATATQLILMSVSPPGSVSTFTKQ